MPTLSLHIDSTPDPSDQVAFDVASTGVSAGAVRSGHISGLGYYNGFIRIQIPTLDGDLHDILSATLSMEAGSSVGPSSPTLITVTVSAEKADNASIPADTSAEATILGNQSTATKVYSYGNLSTPVAIDVAAIVTEIIARSGWAPNNYIVFALRSTAPTSISNWIEFNGLGGGGVTHSPGLVISYQDKTPAPPGHLVTSEITVDQFITTTSNHRDNEDTLNVIQTVSATSIWNREIFSDISVNQDIHFVGGSRSMSLEDELILNQDVTFLREYNPTVYSDIDTTQDITLNGTHIKQILDDLDVIQDIAVGTFQQRDVVDTLDVNQDIHVSPIQVTVTSVLSIGHTVDNEAILLSPVDVESDLDIQQTITYSGTKSVTVNSDVTFQQLIIATGTLASNNPSDPSYDPAHTTPYPVSYGSYTADSYIVHTPAAPLVTLTPSPVATNRPDLQPAVTRFQDSAMPQTAIYVAIATAALASARTTVLQHPIITPTSTVTLPSPIFGNREELQVTRVQRKALGGDLKVFTDSNWPKIKTLRFQFEHVNDTLRDSYFTFLLATLGLEIKLTDYEGRVWHGFIITPETESTDIDVSTCDNTIGFEFIGVEQR